MSLDLDAFVAQAEVLNHHNRETFTTPFPKAPSRWISHYEFTSYPIELTPEVTSRATSVGSLGPPWTAASPARCVPLIMVPEAEAATIRPAWSCSKWPPMWINTSIMPSFVRTSSKRRRDVATGNSPGFMTRFSARSSLQGRKGDDLCHFRYRVGDAVIHQVMAVAVDLLERFGLIKGELLSTDGQLEPSYSHYKGCAYACHDCQALPIDQAARQARGEQLKSGAKRLQITCPFPDVVDQVHQVTAQGGTPKDPKVALLEIETVPDDKAVMSHVHQVA